MSVRSKIHDAIFEEEEKPTSLAYAGDGPVPRTAVGGVYPTDIDKHLSSTVAVDGQIYKDIKEKTSDSNCPNLSKYRAMVNTLSRSIQDPTIRNKAALDASGIILQQIIDEVQGLRQALKEESNRVSQKLDDAQKQLVDQTQNQADALKKEIENKQNQLSNLLANIETSKSKVSQKRSDFSSAVNLRSSELDQLEKEINNLR